MRHVSAFSDESGTVVLGDVDGRYFVVCAVFMRREDEEANRDRVVHITREMQFGAELKSSALKNPSRREELLRRLNELPLNTFYLVVDKDNVERGSGLSFKRTAFKYFNRRLFDRLYGFFESTSVVADEHGRKEYMEQFEAYLRRELGSAGRQRELFREKEKSFRFEKSEIEPLIQVADVFAGSLRRCLDGKGLTTTRDLVQAKATGFVCFPPDASLKPKPGASIAGANDTEQDRFIRSYCGRVASDFTISNAEREDLVASCKILDYLLQERAWGVERFISTGEVSEFLRSAYGMEVSEHQFRNMIGRLRDEGVILASSPQGYKVPTTLSDLNSYVGLIKNVVLPMLNRLADAHVKLMSVSQERVDILEGDNLFRDVINVVAVPSKLRE